MHLLVADPRALHAQRLVDAGGHEEHVAVAQQLLRAAVVDHRAAVHLGRHREGDTGGDVGLDDAGDDVDRRALGGDDQMHARRARQLRQAADAVLHLAGADHHQVGQLVDDDHHLRHDLLAGLQLLVVALDVAHVALGELLVAHAHLRHRPVQRRRGLLGVGHDGGDQVGDVVVDGQLHHLRVDQDHAHLLRGGAVEDGCDDGVDAHRLTGAGLSGDQHVGHLRDVRHDVAPGVVLAQTHRDLRRVALGLGALQHIAQAHHLHLVVGDLHAHGGLARDRGLDAHRHGRKAHGHVVRQRGDAAHLHARRGLQLKARHRRAVGDAHQPRVDAEGVQRLDQHVRLLHVRFLVRLRHLLLIALLQQIDGRIIVDFLLVLRLRYRNAAELRGLDCGVGHVEGRLIVLLRLLLGHDIIDRQRLHALHHALGLHFCRCGAARLEALRLLIILLHSEEVRHVGVGNVLHRAFSGPLRLGPGGVLAQLAQRLGNLDVRGLLLDGIRRGRLRVDGLLVQLALRRAALGLRSLLLRLALVDHDVIPLRVGHLPRGSGRRALLRGTLRARSACLRPVLRLRARTAALRRGSPAGRGLVELVILEHTFYVFLVAALFHVVLALLAALPEPAVAALGAAVGKQAEHGSQHEGNETAPLAQVGVEGIGQQRADGSATAAVLVGLADEVGEACDAHPGEHGLRGEELHRGEGAEEEQHVGDGGDDADALSNDGEHQQRADPREEQGDQHADAAAEAPEHIADPSHGGAGGGRDQAEVARQQGKAEADDGGDDLAGRAAALRPFLVYALIL